VKIQFALGTTATNFDAGADDLIVGSSGDSGITIYMVALVRIIKVLYFLLDSTVGSSAEKKGQISYDNNG
jgi:hypothetical protein